MTTTATTDSAREGTGPAETGNIGERTRTGGEIVQETGICIICGEEFARWVDTGRDNSHLPHGHITCGGNAQ